MTSPGHDLRVAAMCRLMGQALELPRERAQSLALAAGLHDVGKLGVDWHILNKPGRLNREERKAVELHPLIGARLLAPGRDPEVRLAALTHHERWDGQGYPSRLKGLEIPLFGRIIAIADVYDALVSERCYKEPVPHDEAMGVIWQGAGSQFEPGLVEVFHSVMVGPATLQ